MESRKYITGLLFRAILTVLAVATAQDEKTAVGTERIMARALPRGAVCLLDIRDGRAIACSGAELLAREGRPVGSLMKILTTYALVAAGAPVDEVFYCPPSSPEVWATDACWFRPGHGNMSLKSALAHSCNAYFRQWLAQLDLAPAALLARRLRLVSGSLPVERSELQGALTGFTAVFRPKPIELACALAALFNGGVLYSARPSGGGFRLVPVQAIELDARALGVILEGMRECAAAGTGQRLQRAAGLTPLLAKTGTAPHWTPEGPDYLKTDGWCVVVFPADKPRYLLLALQPAALGSETAEGAAKVIEFLAGEGLL